MATVHVYVPCYVVLEDGRAVEIHADYEGAPYIHAGTHNAEETYAYSEDDESDDASWRESTDEERDVACNALDTAFASVLPGGVSLDTPDPDGPMP